MHITHRQHFFDHLAQTSDFPLALEIASAEGLYLFDTHGKRYADLISGIGVSNVGHRHPAVTDAIKNQLDRYMHLMVYGEYIQTPQTALAAALAGTLDLPLATQAPYGKIDNIYFTNSGTEAVEGAMKLAKRFTGRHEFISCINAYHGASQGALSLSGQEFFKRNFRPLLPGVSQIEHGKIADLGRITSKTAAIIIEVISAEAGVRIPSRDFVTALRQRCTETGTLLILDEIQTGFGRTGTFWAFEDYGIYPDILLSAKGMGGGMPIGAFMAPQSLMRVFKNNPVLGHITTFGGHPVSCAASLATLQTILSGSLISQSREKGQLIQSLLVHPRIREIRGKGLMLAAEFGSFNELKSVIDTCLEKGIITDWFLFCDHAMRLAPPLTITVEEIREACGLILEALDQPGQ